MRRGFKTQCENRAAEVRRTLNLESIAPLDPWVYAQHLSVVVLDFKELGLSAKSIRQLTVDDEESWSAMTMKEGSTLGIVLNPAHAVTRQRNDLTHELAHIELRHIPARVEVSKSGLLLLSDYSDEQEQEADWHAGTLLLPRAALIYHRAHHKPVEDIARHYGISPPLCEWRLRMTGADVQVNRARFR